MRSHLFLHSSNLIFTFSADFRCIGEMTQRGDSHVRKMYMDQDIDEIPRQNQATIFGLVLELPGRLNFSERLVSA